MLLGALVCGRAKGLEGPQEYSSTARRVKVNQGVSRNVSLASGKLRKVQGKTPSATRRKLDKELPSERPQSSAE